MKYEISKRETVEEIGARNETKTLSAGAEGPGFVSAARRRGGAVCTRDGANAFCIVRRERAARTPPILFEAETRGRPARSASKSIYLYRPRAPGIELTRDRAPAPCGVRLAHTASAVARVQRTRCPLIRDHPTILCCATIIKRMGLSHPPPYRPSSP